MPHAIVKPEKLVAAAVGLLQDELIVPNTFRREGFDQFRGAFNDTVNFTVPGLLPFRDYAWRNNRATPIVFDEYSERKIAITFGGNVYSAVAVTDEQMEMDLDGWVKLITPQVRAVGRGLQLRATSTMINQTYRVTIGGAGANLKGALVEARKVLNAFNVPNEQRWLLCGSDFEAALLLDPAMNLASNVGDAEAVSALRNATIGDRFGFRIVVDQSLPADAAYAMVGSAFVFVSGAPAVPNSVGYGATQSYEGIALRWLRDYDSNFQRDRSVVNTYAGFRSIIDPLVGVDGSNNEFVSTTEHFVRCVKLTLGGTSVYPLAAGELGTISGVTATKAWTPTGAAPVANAPTSG